MTLVNKKLLYKCTCLMYVITSVDNQFPLRVEPLVWHYENMPIQYTVIFKLVKNENVQKKFLIFFSFCSKHVLEQNAKINPNPCIAAKCEN